MRRHEQGAYRKGHELSVTEGATPPGWRRSSRCETGTCVEVRHTGDHVLVRDGKDPHGPVLAFRRGSFVDFISDAKSGAYDRL